MVDSFRNFWRGAIHQVVAGQGLVLKLHSLQPIVPETKIEQAFREIPNIALIHERHLRILIQNGAEQRSARAEDTHHKDWFRITHFYTDLRNLINLSLSMV